MKISFLLYPTAKVKVDEDSSFWMMHELARRGHEVSYFQSDDLQCREGRVVARLRAARLHPRRGFLPSPLSASPLPLESQQAIFIRKEPPFDNEYLYTLQLLSLLKERVFLLNDPDGVTLCNEKLSILMFPRYITDTLVTASAEEALRFARSLKQAVVLKPLNQKGGEGIYKLSATDPGFHARVYASTRGGTQKMMIQRYLPHRVTGDKRVLLLNGEIVGVFLRRPARKDFRANLGLGGSMHRAVLTRREKKMVEAVAPTLLRYGHYFVGLDLIAGRLSEINVTSPSGIPEMRRLYGVRLEKKVADFIERHLSSSAGHRR